MRCLVVALFLAVSAHASERVYPLSPASLCGATRTCQEVIDAWNDATWRAVVDENISPAGDLAAVRWYKTEGTCDEALCNDQLHTLPNRTSNAATHHFVGVTDEQSNVLLTASFGTSQARFQKLRNFTELLRSDDINGLQCWQFYIDGRQTYDSPADVCVEHDSASDASLRMLGAYAVGCAKQRAGIWSTSGYSDYCADYELQGNAIWGTPNGHGEIKRLANGDAFLANGYRNQEFAPDTFQAFRPDYYELQFLMDFAVYANDPAKQDDVIDMLRDYVVSLGSNVIHRGKSGKFDSTTTTYTCTELCSPAYMDNADTWRAIPAISGLLVAHPSKIPAEIKTAVFDQWWSRYGGPSYPAVGAKPFEIYAEGTPAVKQDDSRYKVYGMWLPLAVAYDATYVRDAIDHLVDVEYKWSLGYFDTAKYYGAYYSQFAQRAIAAATGLIDPRSYLLPPSNVVATATSASSVRVTWSLAAGATSYEIARRSSGSDYAVIATVAAPPYDDGGRTAGTAYVYRVRSVAGASTSSYSTPDLAYPFAFTDEVVQAAVPIRAAHVDELRAAANSARAAAGLPGFAFTDPAIAGTACRAVHVNQLHEAVDAARVALGIAPMTFPSVAIGGPIKAAHIAGLREGIR
jgi:hypothetical protein